MQTVDRRRSVLAAAGLALGLLVAPVRAEPPGPPLKIVVQMSDADPAKWALALNNVRNVQTELPDDAPEIELVAYGPGLGMLKGDSPVASRIAEALKNGVKVVACENTMKAFKLGYPDMLPNIGYVNAGVVEIARRQRDGYAYIRP